MDKTRKEKMLGILFEVAVLLKRNGYSVGSRHSFVQFDDDYVYDGDTSHPESHCKGEIRIYDFYFKNGADKPGQYELPDNLDVTDWLQTEFGVFFLIKTVGIADGKKYVGTVERKFPDGRMVTKECRWPDESNEFDRLEDIIIAGIYTSLRYLMA